MTSDLFTGTNMVEEFPVEATPGTKELQLRDYQEQIIEKLREGFAAGYKSQILYAPTGAGKTEMAISLLQATQRKGNRGAMVLDRIVLCDQTSQRLTKYDIDHGVLQSGHWRHRPWEAIQVCSAQTLEKRGSFPGTTLLIIDEAHAMRRATIDFIRKNPDIRVIGLTATPFTKGIGNVYQNVVSSITTAELVNRKVLVPLRVFLAKAVNMEGAKKVAGEWSQADAQTRGIQIVGDVVTEWVKKTYEVFGRPAKTIIFSAGVKHAEELARKFAEQGYNFQAISYRDDDQFKRDVIEDFSRPDTEIHGLIATDILTKGFDVPDVLIGVSARPFSKSLSSHIQQMGRVMRGAPGKEFALWLDHSGNYLRFKEDWDDIYAGGVHELDDGKEKPKREPSDREKTESKCPVCSALWPPRSDTCSNCGHVRKRVSDVIAVPGKMEEIGTNTVTFAQKQEFWSQLLWYVNNGRSPGWAAHTYREKFGVWPRGLTDEVKMPTPETDRFIQKRLRAYLRGRRK
jgi:superfamily II DNA or RNA helicase